MKASDLVELSLLEAVRGIRSRAFSSLEYTDALIEACEAGRHLNALVSWDWDMLRDAARAVDAGAASGGCLAGVPLVLKDNINTARLPTSGGTGALKSFRPKTDAPIATALFSEGALLGGKGNMHELAFGITNNNAVCGPARNPYDPELIPGGSSGGVGVAVAQGMMPAGIGTDTGASVRLPAALCGIVGFRPTCGRYSGAGIIPISHTRDTAGPMTQTVADAILLDSVMAGKAAPEGRPDLPKIRIGVPRGYFYEDLDPEIAKASEAALRQLEAAGVQLVEIDIPDLESLNAAVGFPIALYEFTRDLPAYLEEHGSGFSLQEIFEGVGSADVKAIFGSQLGDGAMPEAAYRQALETDRPLLQKAYADYFADHRLDAAIFPTAPLPARPIGDDETVELNGRRVPTFTTFIHNTDPASNAGIPGISIPIGLTASGLPIGIELDGPAGSDSKLLAVALAVEDAIGVRSRPSGARAGKTRENENA